MQLNEPPIRFDISLIYTQYAMHFTYIFSQKKKVSSRKSLSTSKSYRPT